jgi:cysteine synthase
VSEYDEASIISSTTNDPSPSVCTAPGDRVPGPRSYALLAPVEFPWRDAVDHVEHIGSHDSFTLSLKLCRNGIVCGPSSGFNLQGLFNLIEKRKAEGTLSELAGEDGLVNSVFLCCDLPYQYLEEYFAKLGKESFPAIQNEVSYAHIQSPSSISHILTF